MAQVIFATPSLEYFCQFRDLSEADSICNILEQNVPLARGIPAYQESFKTASRQTCGEYARGAYGITEYTWKYNLSLLRKGPGVLKQASTLKDCKAAGRAARAHEAVTTTSEAIKWWSTMLSMWDAVRNYVRFSPELIEHTILLQLYVAEISRWGTWPPLKLKNGSAPGSWFDARREVLRRLSVTHYRMKPVAAGSSMTLA
eukprot:1785808-Pleurochrysis_carterae.AAC.4